jgi:hypothetical protein
MSGQQQIGDKINRILKSKKSDDSFHEIKGLLDSADHHQLRYIMTAKDEVLFEIVLVEC